MTTRRKKFRFVVTGQFELEINATSQEDAAKQAFKAFEVMPGCDYVDLCAKPSRDWQVLNGGVKK